MLYHRQVADNRPRREQPVKRRNLPLNTSELEFLIETLGDKVKAQEELVKGGQLPFELMRTKLLLARCKDLTVQCGL